MGVVFPEAEVSPEEALGVAVEVKVDHRPDPKREQLETIYGFSSAEGGLEYGYVTGLAAK